jgi:hypothetical protein
MLDDDRGGVRFRLGFQEPEVGSQAACSTMEVPIRPGHDGGTVYKVPGRGKTHQTQNSSAGPPPPRG